MFGVFGFAFPAGLILYWTVSNLFQIGQQAVMLRLGHIGPQALDRRLTEAKSKAETRTDKPRTGIMGRMMERAEQERKRRLGEPEPLRKPPPRSSGSSKASPKGTAKGSGSGARESDRRAARRGRGAPDRIGRSDRGGSDDGARAGYGHRGR